MKKTMKLLGIALAIIALTLAMSISIFAAETVADEAESSAFTVGGAMSTTASTLEEAISASEYFYETIGNVSILGSPVITLNADYTVTEDFTVESDYPIIINLNGNDMTVAEGKTLSVGSAVEIKGEGNVSGDVQLTNGELTVSETVDTTNMNVTSGVSTMAELIEALANGEKIKLVADISARAEEYYEYWYVKEGAELDLNEHTISTGEFYILVGGADFTIKNGTISAPDDENITNDGHFSIEEIYVEEIGWVSAPMVTFENCTVDYVYIDDGAGIAVDGGNVGVKLYDADYFNSDEEYYEYVTTLRFCFDPSAYLPEGYEVVENSDGTYGFATPVVVTYVAEVDGQKFETVLAALTYAIDNSKPEVKILQSTREVMPTDVELILNADLTLTAEAPVEVKFYNDGTTYDFIINSNNNNTLTIGENVSFILEDRTIWLGYYGNNVDVVVNGTLKAGYQMWVGADLIVNETGTAISAGEALVIRRGVTVTVDGGDLVANYFSILSGNIDAKNGAEITSGPLWINNNGGYANEGNVNISIIDSTLTSTGNIAASSTHADGVNIAIYNSTVAFTNTNGYGAGTLDENTTVSIAGGANVTLPQTTNNGTILVSEGVNLSSKNEIANVEANAEGKDVIYEDGKYIFIDSYVAKVDGVGYTTLAEAIAAANGGEVEILCDVSENLASIVNVKFVTNVAGGVTITNTASGDSWIPFQNVTIGSGVTLISANVLTNGAYVNVIEGTLIAGLEGATGGNFYQCNDAKTTVQNGGKIIVNGDIILRYNDEDGAGIYIYGDNDANTVELSTTGYLGAYSGAFYVENAVVTTGTDLRLDFYDLKNGVVKGEESDDYNPVIAEFVNSTANITGQLRLYKDANLILNNSNVHVGTLQVRALAKPVVTVDAGSTLTANVVEVVTGALVDAARDDEGNVTFKPMVAQVGTKTYSDLMAAIDAANAGDTIIILAPIVIDKEETIVLDLGGVTLSYEGTAQGEAMITNYGNLTIKNGTVTYTFTGEADTSYSKGNYTISNSGTLVVENATIKNDTAKMSHACYAIDNNSINKSAYLTLENGSVVVNANNYAIRQIAGAKTENIVTINDGASVTGTRAVWMQAPSSDTTAKPVIKLNVNGGVLTTNATGEYKLAIYSYTYGNSLENVEINIAGGTFNGDIALSGGSNKTAVEKVTITGGTFNGVDGAIYSYADQALAASRIAIKGGTFNDDTYIRGYAADDNYDVVDNGNGTFGLVAKLPEAEVNNLGVYTFDEYVVYDSLFNTGVKYEGPLAIPVTMQFVAIDSAEVAAKHPYGEYLTDFYITVNGPEGQSFVADEKCYLAGNYGTFGWVVIPLKGQTIEFNKSYPVISLVGAEFTYAMICADVKEFMCGMALSEEIVGAYDISVNLDLGLAENLEAAVKGEFTPVNETVYTEEQVTIKVAKIGETYYTNYADAFAAAKAGDTVEILVAGNFEPTVSEGLTALKNFDGNYVVGNKPTATVNNLGAMMLPAGSYVTYQGGTNTVDRPLSFVMQFIANETAEAGKNSAYKDWYADFVISIEGLDNNFVANGCYMAGYYDFFGGWAVIPLDGTTIENGGRYPVMLSLAGNGQSYEFICESVRDFKCALYLTPEVLEANPNLKVTLELNVIDSSDEEKAVESLVASESEYRYVSASKDYTANEFVVDESTFVAEVDGIKYGSFQTALANANGTTVTLLNNIALDSAIVIAKGENVILDLNGYKLSYENNVMGESMITNNGTLTINDTVGTGEIYYNYNGANDASYGKANNVITNAGTLTVNGGKLHIANIRAHAKYVIDNNSTTGNAILVINGGHLYNYNTSAIRQFCNSTTNTNSVTINGGVIEGYCAIWVQNPGKNTVNGNLTINGGEIKTTAAAYVNGTPLNEVGSNIYFTIDGEGGAWSASSFVKLNGGTFNENVYLAENAPADYTIGEATFNGRLELPAPKVAEVNGVKYTSLADAIANANDGDTITILTNIDLGTGSVTIKGKELTIDLNGNTITGSGYRVLVVDLLRVNNADKQGVLTLVNGTVENTGTTAGNSYAVYVGGSSKLIVGESATVKSANGYAVVMLPMGAGRVSELVVNGGTITGRYAISGNGQLTDTSTVVTVNSGSIIGTETAIYQPQPGTVTVNGGTITGGTEAAIAMRNGTLDINDGTVNGLIDIYGDYSAVTATLDGGDFTNATLKYAEGNTVTKATDVTLPAPEGYEWSTASGVDTLVECTYVAEVDGKGYATLADAIANANGKTVTLLANIDLGSDSITIKAGNTVTLDLNGYVISGTCETAQDYMIMVENTATLTINDKVGTGKITYAKGASDTGWAIDLKGNLELNAGTIELTGDSWSIGYAVDVRPNSWGTAYTEGTVFTMNGGKVVSSDAAIRVASSSADNHTKVSASFVMNGGEIEAGWDGIFIQQSNTVYDVLGVEINAGKITSALAPIRFYGLAKTSVVGNKENPMTLAINGGEFVCEGDASKTWIVPNVIMVAGGATVAEILAESTLTKATTVSLTAPEGYEWSTADGVDTLVEVTYVAEVDGVKYTSLQAAINDANDKTVVILEDIALADGIVVSKGTTVTIELNGKTISRNTELATSTAAITNNGNLTIQDTIGGGKITAFAKNPDTAAIPYYASNTITNGGTLTILGGTIENSTSNEARAAFPIDNNSTSGDAIVYIKGGVITGRGAIRQFANSTTYANKVEISGGEIVGTSYAIWTQNPGSNDPLASLKISDGTVGKILMSPSAGFTASITGGTVKEIAIWDADTTNPERNPSGFVSGGTFLTDVSDFCADGYECVANQDGTYGIEEKEEIPQLTWDEVSLTLGSDLKMNFYIYKDGMVDGVHYYAKVVKIHGDGCADGVETYYIPMEKWEDTPTRKRIVIDNIAAKEMNCTFEVAIYAGEVPADGKEGTQVTGVASESIIGYALWMLRDNKSASAEEKTLMVDLLNYGAAAQINFGHYSEPEHLANYSLTAAEQNLATTKIISTPVLDATGSYCDETTLELEETTYLNFYFANIKSIAGFDQSLLSVNVRFTHHSGTEHNVTITGEDLVWNGSRLKVSVTDLAAADANIQVTCTVSYNGSAIAAITTNIADYCNYYTTHDTSDANLTALCDAIMKYATSAYNYFHK